jgi:environmental stress-induced protein Ves
MQISLVTTGGFAYFPGLQRPIVVDTGQLNDAEERALTHLVEQANFFELPATLNTPHPGSADYQNYTLTIRKGRRQHSVQFVDPINHDPLQALVEYVQQHGVRQPAK